ncbi:hypothetical protein Tco_0612312 [Tanacetum coccineum]
MSKSVNQSPSPDGSVVRNTTKREARQRTWGLQGSVPDEVIANYVTSTTQTHCPLIGCESAPRKNYKSGNSSLVPNSVKKKAKNQYSTRLGIHTLLNPNLSVSQRIRRGDLESSHRRDLEKTDIFMRLRERDRSIFDKLGSKEPDVFARLEANNLPRHKNAHV